MQYSNSQSNNFNNQYGGNFDASGSFQQNVSPFNYQNQNQFGASHNSGFYQNRQNTPDHLMHSQFNYTRGGFGGTQMDFFTRPDDTQDQIKLTYSEIAQDCASKIGANPKEWFKKYNGYQKREFQVWELCAMFDLQPIQAQILVLSIEDGLDVRPNQFLMNNRQVNQEKETQAYNGFGQQVEISKLCTALSTFNHSILATDLPHESIYVTAKQRLPLKTLNDFQEVAKQLTKDVPSSKSYQEAFQLIQKHYQKTGVIYRQNFFELLSDKFKLSEDKKNIWQKLIDEFICQNDINMNEINIVMFVQAMQHIHMDYQFYNARDVLSIVNSLQRPQGNLHQRSNEYYYDDVSDLPEGVKKLGRYFLTEDYQSKFQQNFSNPQKLHIKNKYDINGDKDVRCIRYEDFITYLKSVENSKSLLTDAEAQEIYDEYSIEQFNVLDKKATQILKTQATQLSSTIRTKSAPRQKKDDRALSQSGDAKALKNATLKKDSSKDSLQAKGLSKEESKESLSRSNVEQSIEQIEQFSQRPNKFQNSHFNTIPEVNEEAKEQTQAQLDKVDEDDELMNEREELKEGGQDTSKLQKQEDDYEWYEGGDDKAKKQATKKEKHVCYLNYDRLWADICASKEHNTPQDQKRVYYLRCLKFYLLEGMKGYTILVGNKIMDILKSNDREGTLTLNKSMINSVLFRIMGDIATNEIVDACKQALLWLFLQVSRKEGKKAINYVQLYQFFCNYANQSVITQDMDRTKHDLLKTIKMTDQKKQLSLLIGNEDGKAARKRWYRNQPYIVASFEFSYHLGKNQSEVEIDLISSKFKVIRKEKDKNNYLINVNRYYELIGFPKEVLPTFNPQTSFVKLCAMIQRTFKFNLKTIDKQHMRDKSQQDFYIWFNNYLPIDKLGQKDLQILKATVRDCISKDNKNVIITREFIKKLQFAMMQLWYMQRCALQIFNRIGRDTNVQFEDIFADPSDNAPEAERIPEQDKINLENGEITKQGFKNFLKRFNVIYDEDNVDDEEYIGEFKYFATQYNMLEKEEKGDGESKNLVKLQISNLKEDYMSWLDDIQELCKSIVNELQFFVERRNANRIQNEQFYQTTNNQPSYNLLQLLKDAQLVNFTEDELQKIDQSQKVDEYQQNQDRSQTQKPQNLSENLWLRSIDFEQWFQNEWHQCFQFSFPTELLVLFTKFHSIKLGTKNKFYIPALLRYFVDNYNIQDQNEVQQFVLQYDLDALKNRVIDALFFKGIQASNIFQGHSQSVENFSNMLHDPIFSPNTYRSAFSSLLNELIHCLIRTQGTGSSNVNVSQWNEEIDDILEKRQTKAEILRKIHRKLQSKGQTIEEAICALLGNNSIETNVEVKKSHINLFCKTYIDQPVDPKDMQKIYASLPKDMYGECTTQSFLKDFKQIISREPPSFMQDEQILRSDREQRLNVVTGVRYMVNVDASITRIVKKIVDQNMKNFGQILKGKELQIKIEKESPSSQEVIIETEGTGRISNGDFFILIEKLFPDLGNGDIVDLVQHFDPENEGTIPLENIRMKFEYEMQKLGHEAIPIKLVNDIDTMLKKQLFDKIETKESVKGRPKQFKLFVIDMYCGLYTKKDRIGLEHYLKATTNPKEKNTLSNYIDFKEFKSKMEDLGVFFDTRVKQEIFRYLKLKQTDTSNSLNIKIFESSLYQEFKMVNEESVAEQIIRLIVPYIADQRLPVRELCTKHETSKGSSQILAQDFVRSVLKGELQLQKLLTQNMFNMLELAFNLDRSETLMFERFIQMVYDEAQKQGLKIFTSFKEIEEEEKSHLAQRQKAKYKQEPNYIPRSAQNTYIKREEVNIAYGPLEAPERVKLIEEIMVLTRAKEKSVEGFFQKYGQFSPEDGLRHLTRPEFRRALAELDGITWFNDETIVKDLWLHMCECVMLPTDDRYGLTLEQIGSIVVKSAVRTMISFEGEILENVLSVMTRNQQVRGISKLFNFVDFFGTGSISLDEFKSMLKDTFQISQTRLVSESQIKLLGQRYRDYSSSNSENINFYKFVHEIAYASQGIPLEVQWASQVVETLLKGIQTKRIFESGSQGLEEYDVFDNIISHFGANCQQGKSGMFSEMDMQQCFRSLKLAFDRENKNEELERLVINFYKLAGMLTVGVKDQDLNPIVKQVLDFDKVQSPRQIDFQQMSQCVHRFLKKPLKGLYWDVIDQVFMSSKQRDINIKGPYIRSLFNQFGNVTTCSDTKLHELITQQIAVKGEIKELDMRFLLSKYLTSLNRGANFITKECSFKNFLEDYYECEENGLCESIAMLFKVANKDRDDKIAKKMFSGEGFRTLDMLPKEQQQIYKSMGDYYRRKDMVELLQGEFIQNDEGKEGFLTEEVIVAAVGRTGVKISREQRRKLLNPLSEDKIGQKSYLELICFLFGLDVMLDLIEQEKIGMDREKALIDRSKLSLSRPLKEEIELKLHDLNDKCGQKALSMNDMKKHLVECEINISDIDAKTIAYFYESSVNMKGVDWGEFKNFFNIDGKPSEILITLQRAFKGHSYDQIFVQPHYDYNKLVTLLKQQCLKEFDRFGAPNLKNLFDLMSQGKKYIAKEDLIQYLKGKDKKGQERGRKLPQVPQDFYLFVDHCIQKKAPIFSYSEIKGKEKEGVTRNTIDRMIDRTQYQGSRSWVKFFTQKNVTELFNVKMFKEYVLNYRPNFGSDWKQQEIMSLETAGEIMQSLPHEVKSILSRFCRAVRENNLQGQDEQGQGTLMKELDKNKSGDISFEEFDEFCVKKNLSQGLSRENLERLFNYLDVNQDGTLSRDELQQIVDASNLTHEELMNSAFSLDLIKELHFEIQQLFLELDTNSSGYLCASELRQFMCQQQPEYQISELVAQQVINELNNGQSQQLSLDDFIRYVEPKQKEMLLSMDDSMEDLRKLFVQFASKQGSISSNKGELNPTQLKQLIVETGYKDVKDFQIQELFREIDTDRSGYINVDEFMAYMYTGAEVKTGSRDTLFRIRKAHLKMNKGDVFRLLKTIPKFSVPSFTQPYLENNKQNIPSKQLIPQFDFKTMSYNNAERGADYIKMEKVPKTFLGKHYKAEHKNAMVVQILDIRGVPSLKQFQDEGGNEHLELRAFLYNEKRKVLVSSIIVANVSQRGQQKGESCDWLLSKAFSQIALRVGDSERTKLVFELVRYAPDDLSKQICICYTSVEVATLAKQTKPVLELKGGSPFSGDIPIETGEENSKRTFFGIGGAKKITRQITLQVTQMVKLDNQTQMDLALMNDNFLVWKSLLPFARSFRLHAYESTSQRSAKVTQPQGDLIISQIEKIYDSPDVQEAIGTAWSLMAGKSPQVEKEMRLMQKMVERLYAVVTSAQFLRKRKESVGLQDMVYPCRSSSPLYHKVRLDMLLAAIYGDGTEEGDLQNEAIKHQIHNDHSVIEEIDFVEEYTPFSIGGDMCEVADVMGVKRENDMHRQAITEQLKKISS